MTSITVRDATEKDLPILVGMGEAFFSASEYADVTTFSREKFESTARELIASDAACLKVVDDGGVRGMVAGVIFPFYFSDELCAQELFWWAEKGGRALLEAFEAWAKEKGASAVTMICLDRLGRDRVTEIYTKAGYRPSDHSFIKRV